MKRADAELNVACCENATHLLFLMGIGIVGNHGGVDIVTWTNSHFSTIPFVNDAVKAHGLFTGMLVMSMGLQKYITTCPSLVVTELGTPKRFVTSATSRPGLTNSRTSSGLNPGTEVIEFAALCGLPQPTRRAVKAISAVVFIKMHIGDQGNRRVRCMELLAALELIIARQRKRSVRPPGPKAPVRRACRRIGLPTARQSPA